MRATGQGGVLRYGFQVAARLGPWSIDGRGTFQFTSSVASSDPVWMARRPLDLVLSLGQVEWIWRDVDPVVSGGAVSVELTRRPDVAGTSLHAALEKTG